MAKVTIAEIVAKWQRQMENAQNLVVAHENKYPEGTTNPSPVEVRSYERNKARLEMLKDHVQELTNYALAHAR
jgi:hypothetical protein